MLGVRAHAASLLGSAVLVVCLMSSLLALSAQAQVPPNPCGLVPSALVAPALGVPVGAVHGKAVIYRSHGLEIRSCHFAHGAARLNLVVTAAAHGVRGVSGTGITALRPSGLGAQSIFDYGTYHGAPYANTQFIAGSFWGSVVSTAHVSPTRVLALARNMYAHLLPSS